MKKRTFVSSVILLVLIGFIFIQTGCTPKKKAELPTPEKVEKVSDLKTVSIKDGSVSVDIPKDWVDVIPSKDFDLTIKSPKPDGKLWAHISLSIKNIPGISKEEIPLEELFGAVKEDLDKTFKYEELQKSTMDILGKPVLVVKYDQVTSEGKLPTKQYLIFKDDNRYLFTAISSKDTFDRYEPIFDEVARSIKIQ